RLESDGVVGRPLARGLPGLGVAVAEREERPELRILLLALGELGAGRVELRLAHQILPVAEQGLGGGGVGACGSRQRWRLSRAQLRGGIGSRVRFRGGRWGVREGLAGWPAGRAGPSSAPSRAAARGPVAAWGLARPSPCPARRSASRSRKARARSPM